MFFLRGWALPWLHTASGLLNNFSVRLVKTIFNGCFQRHILLALRAHILLEDGASSLLMGCSGKNTRLPCLAQPMLDIKGFWKLKGAAVAGVDSGAGYGAAFFWLLTSCKFGKSKRKCRG